jgi:flagellar biosynthesis component FlhA
MKKWFLTLGYKLNRFIQGRYGFDELSRFLIIAGLILIIISCFPYLHFLYILGFAIVVWAWVRTLSRNIYKRQMERNRYLGIKNRIAQRFRLYKNIWRDRKAHKFYTCPSCKTRVRITKPEKGKRIMVTCPKCRQRFGKRT